MQKPSRPALAVALAACAGLVAACPNDPTENDDLSWLSDDAGAGEAQRADLDVSSKDAWVYFSFEHGVVTPDKPEESLAWDVAFQRYNLKTNGGTSGPGQGAAADLGEKDLATTRSATVSGWTEDAVIEDARTGDERSMNSVLSGWYSYHFGRHELVSKYSLYAIRAADGRVALFKIYDYYDDAGTAGHLTILYRFPTGADLAPDAGTETPDAGSGEVLEDEIVEVDGVVFGETNFDAREGTRYLSFAERGAVAVEEEPGQSDTWDLSFDLWLLRTNSGTSGGAAGGAKAAATRDFDAAREAPETGWVVDTVQTIGSEQREESTNAEFAGWFEYDSTAQRIRSFEDVYWLRTADGKFAKLQIVSYYHPVTGDQGFFRLRWAYRPDGGRSF